MRKRITQPGIKLGLTAGYALILLVFGYFQIPCFLLSLLGIPCPGCGMTRAVLSALHFQWAAAFRYHPMFWSMPVLYLYFLFDGRLLGRKTDRVLLWSIAVGFFLQWIWKIAEM